MEDLFAELDARWLQMFRQLCDGQDVAPTHRLRTEGMMEAAVLFAGATPEQLQDRMEQAYTQVYGNNFTADFGPRWCEFFPFPQIPAMGKRAPVFPSTSD